MSFHYFGARKRNLSSDTTESSDNEEEESLRDVNSHNKNSSYSYNNSLFGKPKRKEVKIESWQYNSSKNSNENGNSTDRNEKGNEDRHEEGDEQKGDSFGGNYSNFAQKLMANMGYTEGRGLGKHEQGRVNIIEASKQRGRRGLGLQLSGLEANEDAEWNWEDDEFDEAPVPDWLPHCNLEPPTLNEMQQWLAIGPRKETINDETKFCEPEVLQQILNSKNVFDMLGSDEFLKARTRSNPFETIRGAIFQNRAAMKMAEIDASFDFMFTDPKDSNGRSLTDSTNLLYFADICAGPGGFSEYVLWRKKWHAKGYGLTLKADGANDFKINDFLAGSPETFEPHYGVGGYEGDGDIFREDNLIEFRKFVLENTDDKGVHFVMADGGFSVEGQENIQEILSKQLYLCQFLCALSIIRPGGHFYCKLFDIFTPFSVGCIYLLYRAFEQICIFKPVTSRPANSERYVVCRSKLSNTEAIHDYMFELNTKINQLKKTQIDVIEVVPMELLRNDDEFYDYIYESNNSLGRKQIMALIKLKTFVQNTLLSHPNQGEIRKRCLVRWNIPDDARAAVSRSNPEQHYMQLIKNVNIRHDVNILTESLLRQALANILDFKCCVSGGPRVFLLSLGRFHIFKWEPNHRHIEPQWKNLEVTNFELPRDTLIEAEIVSEFKGEGRGQRRVQAVHVIDAIYLGGDFVGDKPFSDRMKCIELFAKALYKPSRPSMTILRSKKIYRLMDIHQIYERMDVRQMKNKSEQKLCYAVDNERYFTPNGLHFFKSVKDPWSLNHSRSQRKLYFFNRRTGASVFESPGSDSFADFEYCLRNRWFWHWRGKDGISATGMGEESQLGKDVVLEFVEAQARKLGLV